MWCPAGPGHGPGRRTRTHTRARTHTHTPNAHTHQTRILVYVGGGAWKEVGPAAEQMYNNTCRRVRACDGARAAYTAVRRGAPEARCGGRRGALAHWTTSERGAVRAPRPRHRVATSPVRGRLDYDQSGFGPPSPPVATPTPPPTTR